VLLILRRALARQDAPATARIHADGMVRAICGVYQQFSDHLSPALRRRAGEGRGLFYTADGRVRPVGSARERQEILDGPPCVVVSSSGMLAGGPSTWYAARLARRPEALICITGYQDEEAPGRQLQSLAAGSSRELRLDGVTVEVACQVSTYGLSAHADAQQLAGLVQALGPAQAALVHGDAGARQGLSGMLAAFGLEELHLPAAGDTLEVRPARPGRPRPAVPATGGGRALDEEGLEELRRQLQGHRRARGTFTLLELAERWYGSAAVPVDLGPLARLVAGRPDLFSPDRKRPHLLRLADPQQPAPPGAPPAPPPPAEDGPMEQNAALALADELLGPQSGLYRTGAERDSGCLRLYFHFPDVAARSHAGALEELARRSGWEVKVHPEAQQAALERAVHQALATAAEPLRAPSILREQRLVRVKLADLPDADVCAEIGRSFQEQTGFSLELQQDEAHPPAAGSLYDDTGRMELNAAMREIDRAFAGLPRGPYRKSKKSGPDGPFLELSFVSPEVGKRHQALLDDLAYRTSWRITVADRVDQQGVLTAARQLLKDSVTLRKQPGLDLAGRKVRIKPASPPPLGELDRLDRLLEEATGFTLEVV
jgi:hypothetical protein